MERTIVFMKNKFRTMTDEPDGQGNLLPDDVRLGKFGKVLRSTSFNELPEALDILIGDGYIIGITKEKLDFSRVVTA